MNIRQKRELKDAASAQLSAAPQAGRILLIYCGITLGLSALVTVVNYCLGLEISQTGGLKNIGIRSVLSTIQTVLPMIQTVVLMALELGYTSAMLRVARGQYASPNGLRLGFDRFWVLLRCSLLRGLIYFTVGMVSIYVGVIIYLMTPLSEPAMELLTPLVADAMTSGESALVMNEAIYDQVVSAMTPALILCGILFLAVAAPFFYQYRMADYLLIDRPGIGAFAALKESRKMMKGNKLHMLRLDISLWWYYAALLAASLVCYGDQILPMLGVNLPLSGDVGYFVFFGLYLAVTFVVYYFLRNRVEVTYALAYDSLRPKEPENTGVVLGNIFQM